MDLNNKNEVLEAIKNCEKVAKFLIPSYEKDEILERYRNVLENISDELKNDKEFMLEAVKNDWYGEVLQYASDELKADKEFMLGIIKNYGYGSLLMYASDELKNDREVVMEAVKNNNTGEALEYASDELKVDKDIVLEAVKNDGWALKYASDELKKDKEFILEAVNNNIKAFEILGDINKELQRDSEIIDTVINKFSTYECSKDYDLDSLKNNPEQLTNILKTINFETEYLVKDDENKIQFG